MKKNAPKRILITGSSGYIGSNLINYLKQKSDYLPLELNFKNKRIDITDKKAVLKSIKHLNPDIIVHTAWINSLTLCEKNPKTAYKVNVEGTKNIIQAVNNKIKLIFLSSDYVFKGDRGNYKENDQPNPLTVYGKNKLSAELAIKKNLKNYLICRTAGVFSQGGNFYNFAVENLKEDKEIEVYNNCYFTPTYLEYLLFALTALIEKNYQGIIHVAGGQKLSRYKLALYMAKLLNKPESQIKPIKKPVNSEVAYDSSLNTDKIKKILNGFSPSAEKSLNYAFGNLLFPYFMFDDSRGKFKGINQNFNWQEINYIESAKNSTRGNHYHKIITEGFFIIDGRVKILLDNLLTKTKQAFTAEAGDAFIVKPFTVHTFVTLTRARWINMLSKPIRGKYQDFHKI